MSGSSLLEFVMSLAHDPAMAAAYAADPEQVLHGAGLVGVAAADIEALLPIADSAASGTVLDSSIWRASDAAHAFDVGDLPGDVTADLPGNLPMVDVISAPPAPDDPTPMEPIVPEHVEPDPGYTEDIVVGASAQPILPFGIDSFEQTQHHDAVVTLDVDIPDDIF